MRIFTVRIDPHPNQSELRDVYLVDWRGIPVTGKTVINVSMFEAWSTGYITINLNIDERWLRLPVRVPMRENK